MLWPETGWCNMRVRCNNQSIMPDSPAQQKIESGVAGLPEVPLPWRSRYRVFESVNWIGWISNQYWFGGVEQQLDDVEQLFSDISVNVWYKQHRNRLAEIKWPGVADSPELVVVLKSYGTRTSLDNFRSPFKPSRAIRHWQNAWELLQRGVNTPMPIFIAIPKNRRANSFLLAVEPAVPHTRVRTLLHEIIRGNAQLDVGDLAVAPEWLAECCGRYIRSVHDSGILHRDFSGGNVLIPRDWDGTDTALKSKFILLDINRIWLVSPQKISINQRIQDLERLTFPESLLERYFMAYAGDNREIGNQLPRFLKYRKAYRKLWATENPFKRSLLKMFTYWPRTG